MMTFVSNLARGDHGPQTNRCSYLAASQESGRNFPGQLDSLCSVRCLAAKESVVCAVFVSTSSRRIRRVNSWVLQRISKLIDGCE